MRSSKSFLKIAALLLVLQQSMIHAFAQPSTPRDSTWITNGPVYAVAYSKGLTYIGGDFTYVGPNTGHGAVLSTTTGAPNLKFPKVNGPIYVVTADGADGWYIGGNFTKVGDFTRNWIAHLKADGTVDPNWNPNPTGSLISDPIHIHVIVVSGSTVYVGGSFTSIGGQERRGLAALNASTGQATSWNPNSSGIVRAIAINGEIVYAGGDFAAIGGQNRQRLAAIDMATGSATAWNPALNARVHSIVISDTLLFAGGEFTSAGGQVRNRLAAFGLTSGQVTGWNPNADNMVFVLALKESTLYVGGAFLNIGGLWRSKLAALSIYSSTPLSWNPNVSAPVRAIYLNGSTVYVGGDFTHINGKTASRIAALDATTGKATAWIANALEPVRGLAANTNGSVVYAGGLFRSIGGQWRTRLAALNAETGFVTAWNPNVNGSVNVMTISGFNIYIGGAFTLVGGNSRNHIAAFSATTGTVTPWNPNANGDVHAITIDNFTVYVGGKFTKIGGQTRNLLAALDFNNGLAKNWNPNLSTGNVYKILVKGATIYAGGDFFSVGAQSRQALVAIDATTGLASAWNPNLNAFSIVYAMALEDSTLYIGGDFNTVKGQNRNRLAAVNITTADPTAWNPNTNGTVRALILNGSNVYAGGDFTSIGAQTRNYLAAVDKATGMPAGWNPNANNYGSGQGLLAVGSAILAGGTFTTMGGNMQDRFAQFGDIVVTNNPPNVPALAQYKSDNMTVIPEGGMINEKKFIFQVTVSDPDDDQVKFQIELRKISEPFTGIPTFESHQLYSGVSSRSSKEGLTAGGYKWRARVIDASGLASDWVEFGAPGNTDFVVNEAPTLTAVNQFKSDATTVITTGGTTNEKKVVFKATISDPDNDQVKLQIELRKFNEAFTSLPNLQSGLLNSGGQVIVIQDSLADANYKWRYRALDSKGLTSFWVDFGASTNTDFVVATNKPPAAPTTLKQLKADGVTAIPEGGTTGENKVIFKAMVADPDSQGVLLQIELRKTAETFSGSPSLQSVQVKSGALATITFESFSGPASYKWRCRTMDAKGLTSAWVEFGAAGNTDFIMNQPPAVSSVYQFKSDETTIISEGGTTVENRVVFKASLNDPNNDQIKLQIELRKMAEAFTGTPNLQSSLQNSWTTVSIAKDSLAFADYKWRFRAMDARGLASDWKEYGTPGNIDFTVAPEIPIYPAVASPQASGKEFWVDIYVGNDAKPVSNLFGVSFVLNFSPYNYIDVVMPYESAVIPGNFMGNDVVLYQTVEKNASRVNVGISRKAGQGGVNGFGRVVQVKFIARADTPDSTQATFNIINVKANDPQGKAINLTPKFKSITIINKNILVWPGDTNNDGIVNQADVLPIGLY
ncbi:MAG: PQQ-binding-like beta-propeller repeat protein [bacterium]